MSVQIEPRAPERLSEAKLSPRSAPHPSPADWRDQILYFLLPDRFSNQAEDYYRSKFNVPLGVEAQGFWILRWPQTPPYEWWRRHDEYEAAGS